MTPADPFEKALDEVFSTFSTQNDDKGITLTWSTKDSVTEAKQALLAAHRAGLRAARADELEQLQAHKWYNDVVADIIEERLAALTPPEPTA